MGNDFEVMCVGYGSTAGDVIDRNVTPFRYPHEHIGTTD